MNNKKNTKFQDYVFKYKAIFSTEDLIRLFNFIALLIDSSKTNKNKNIEKALFVIFFFSKEFNSLHSYLSRKINKEELFYLTIKIFILEYLDKKIFIKDKIKALEKGNNNKYITDLIKINNQSIYKEAISIEELNFIYDLKNKKKFKTFFDNDSNNDNEIFSFDFISEIINLDFSFYWEYWSNISENKKNLINLFQEKKLIFITNNEYDGSIFFKEDLVYIILKNINVQEFSSVKLNYVSGNDLLKYYKSFSNMQKHLLLLQSEAKSVLSNLSNLNPHFLIKPTFEDNNAIIKLSPEKLLVSPFIFISTNKKLILNISGTQKYLNSSSIDVFNINFKKLENFYKEIEFLEEIEEFLKKI